MTLIRPTVKVQNTNISCEKNGKVLVVNLTIQEEEFCFANIYAPNDQNLQVDLYTHLTSMLRPYVNLNLVMYWEEILTVLLKISIKKVEKTSIVGKMPFKA